MMYWRRRWIISNSKRITNSHTPFFFAYIPIYYKENRSLHSMLVLNSHYDLIILKSAGFVSYNKIIIISYTILSIKHFRWNLISIGNVSTNHMIIQKLHNPSKELSYYLHKNRNESKKTSFCKNDSSTNNQIKRKLRMFLMFSLFL